MKKKICSKDWLLGGFLFVLPFLHVCIGINHTDQGYNLANFELFPHMNQTWLVATLVANVVGKIFTWLPFGNHMLGVNVYCTLLLSILSVVLFNVLKKDFSKYAVFGGLVIAICFSWAPKVTLYQYLSYYLFTIATTLVLLGLRRENRRLLFMAGIILGINLFVRFPNLLQTGLIVVVIYSAILKKKEKQELLIDVMVCVSGYLAVAIPIILGIEILLGKGSYLNMIINLFSMTDSAVSYSPLFMILGVVYAYRDNLYWFKWFVAEAVAGVFVYGFLKKQIMRKWMQVFLCLGFVIVLCVFWYEGKLNNKYSTYESVYVWGASLLTLVAIVMCSLLVLPNISYELRLYAMASLIILGITPIGSNNVLYSNYNNLYMLAPVTAGMIELLWHKSCEADERRDSKKIWQFSAMPLAVVSGLLILVTMAQTFLFHGVFVFGDNVLQTKSMEQVEGNSILKGMYTSKENAEVLGELSEFMQQSGLEGKKTIVWSQAPILYYMLDIECAIGHFWPFLDSYPYKELKADIEAMKGYPMIIYQTMYYGDLKNDDVERDNKTQLIVDILQNGEYEEVFRNESFAVCIPRNDEMGW